MSGLRLQIDANALERLLGGNEEAVVELRQSIAEEFGRKHLKAITNSEGFGKFIAKEAEVLRVATLEQVRKHIGEVKGSGYNSTVTVPEAVKSKIEQMVRTTLVALIDEKITAITARVEERLNRIVSDMGGMIDKRISAELTKEVDARVVAKLNSVVSNIPA